MRRWLLELFQGLPDFIKQVLKFVAYCVFVALAIGVLTSIPLNYFQIIGLEEKDAIDFIDTVKGVCLTSILLMCLRLFGVIKMPKMPRHNTGDKEQTDAAAGE